MKPLHFKTRHKVILGIVLTVSMLLFAAPRAGRWYIVKNSVELTGRRLSIGKIRFNYFTGTLTIRDLQLFEADSRSIFASFKRLKINLEYLPLVRNEINVKYVILDDLFAQVLQNGDNFNFSDLMKTDSSAVSTDTVPAKPVKYIINNIRISRGFVKYTDQVLNHTISMNNVDLNIPGFTWNSDSTNLGVDFRFVDGGRLYSKLDVNQADSTYRVNLRLDSLNLDIIEPYVESSMYISALHGYLSNDINITGDMRSIMKLSVTGMNHIFGFQLQDTLKRTVFSFDDLAIDIDKLLLEKSTLSVKSIELKKPFMLFEMIDSSNNWLGLMKPSPGEQKDTLAKASSVPEQQETDPFTFSSMKIFDGKINVSDKSLRYPFEYVIDNLAVSSSPDKKMPGWIDVAMTAGLNGTGDLKAEFAMNPRNSSDLDINLSVNQFRMKDIEPYFRHYFGFPVTGGRMNFSTRNTMRANSLVSTNSLYFRKFTLGKKEDKKSEYNVPLRLALGVMSDKDGIIDLKAPVEMKGSDVKVGNVRKIIFHAIGTLFVKAAVSPVGMIADLFKVDPDKLRKINLSLSGPSPDEKNMESVDLLADILAKKPGLNLDLVYCLNREKTSDTLAYIMALDDYLAFSKTQGVVADSTLSKYIAGKLAADSTLAAQQLKVLCRKYAGTEKINNKIDSLKIQQNTFLQNYLTRDKALAADRFRIISDMPDSIKYEEPVPGFRTYFTAGE